MEEIGKRSSANFLIKKVMQSAIAIGESKARAKSESTTKGQNGHKISTKAHSVKSVQNMRSVTTQYINFVKENYGNRVVQHINKESMQSFLEKKSQEISGGSLSTYISTAGKLVDNFNKVGVNTIERKDIHNIRTEFKKDNVNLSKVHVNRAYHSTDKIIEHIQSSSPFSLSVKLQIEVGLRIDDATNSAKWKLNENNTLTINQSKNGLNYTTVQLDSKLANEVSEAIKEGYKIDKTEYSKALKEAVEQTGQEFNGSHGLRYSFAQERYAELKEYGYLKSESLAELSQNMGHSRSEISLLYIK